MKYKMILSTLFFITMGLLIYTGCKQIVGSEHEEEAIQILLNNEWDLKYFEIPLGTKQDIGTQGIVMNFYENGKIRGKAYNLGDYVGGPNRFEGNYELMGNFTIRFDSVGTTKMYTPPGTRYWEFLDILYYKVDSFKIEENKLWLYYDNRTKALFFVARRLEK
ncbi:MAG: META domain-containing protein [Calditrichaeota bacterium]|nr:META domain-containing protein [Calditrichota bacterium]